MSYSQVMPPQQNNYMGARNNNGQYQQAGQYQPGQYAQNNQPGTQNNNQQYNSNGGYNGYQSQIVPGGQQQQYQQQPQQYSQQQYQQPAYQYNNVMANRSAI